LRARRAIQRPSRSRSSSSPAGRPSTIATSPGPCDSPAVVKRSVATREPTLATCCWAIAGAEPPWYRSPVGAEQRLGGRRVGGAPLRLRDRDELDLPQLQFV